MPRQASSSKRKARRASSKEARLPWIKGKIAGYPIKDLILTFAYDGEYKLIAVKVELIKGNYDDLKTKLTKVYGEGEHKETEEGIWSTVWKRTLKLVFTVIQHA